MAQFFVDTPSEDSESMTNVDLFSSHQGASESAQELGCNVLGWLNLISIPEEEDAEGEDAEEEGEFEGEETWCIRVSQEQYVRVLSDAIEMIENMSMLRPADESKPFHDELAGALLGKALNFLHNARCSMPKK